jgi:hypothetical protein
MDMEAVRALFKAVSQHLCRGMEKNHKKPVRISVLEGKI